MSAPRTAPVMPGLRFDGVALTFGTRTIFHGLELAVPGGAFTVLLGASGVGKSSLLRIAAGLAKPTAGAVTATDGLPLSGRVAYMAQQDLLHPWASVQANVMLGARLRGEAADPERALHLLARVGLQDRARALPAELSGGMRQRRRSPAPSTRIGRSC